MNAANPWEVSVAEYQANSVQFASLYPQNGRIDGNTARNVLMKSNLPPQILAQIWALADTNRDGMLDVREFSIAMRLTRNCLAGLPLPPTLPPSLMQVPVGSGPPQVQPHMNAMPHPNAVYTPEAPKIPYGMSPMQPVPPAFPVYHTAPPGMVTRRMSQPLNGGSVPNVTQGKQCGNWTIPHQAKLRYSQQFNQQDKQRVGFLTGQAGRSALGMSGLPTTALAHIWTLSDVNKDGKLTVDEFCIAMHLIDMVKAGYALPDQTPPELVQISEDFEDKRMDNFARGQAELERRRQLLMEENQKQREAELTAQRQQRQKTLTFQLQALSEKAVDTDSNVTKRGMRCMGRLAHFEGMRDQRDEKMRRIAELQSNNQQLSVQAQELAHQLLQLQSANKETVARKAELEELRKRRDAAKLSVQAQELAHQLLQLQSANKETVARKAELEELRKRRDAAKKTEEYETARAELVKARDDYRRVLHTLADLQTQARSKLSERDAENARIAAEAKAKEEAERELECRRRAAEEAANTVQAQAFGEVFPAPANNVPKATSNESVANKAVAPVVKQDSVSSTGNALPLASAGGTTKYRALFEFNARSEDELSFQPGDVILVFESHAAEPGWKAGQIRDKVGWFPEAFAEPIAPVHSAVPQPIQNMPPNVTPSPSLDRIPEESVVKSIVAQPEATPQEAPVTVICSCVAQFPWKARNEGDLSFAKGDPIEIVEKKDADWWAGHKVDTPNVRGLFPANYVQMSHQQMALDALNQLLTHPDAQKLYTKCTSSVEARGMSLSTFLLLPLGRITRYPLLIEKILKESDPKGDLHPGMDTISFRCVSSNARRLWTSQLEQAIDLYAITASEQDQARKPSLQSKTIGRLLVEVLNTKNISPKMVESPPQILRLSVGRVSETFEVDLSKSADLHLTTQFPLVNTTEMFTLKILQKNLFRPDALLFSESSSSTKEVGQEIRIAAS
ncbi:SH3 domain protein [Ostertagia ostertagi]